MHIRYPRCFPPLFKRRSCTRKGNVWGRLCRYICSSIRVAASPHEHRMHRGECWTDLRLRTIVGLWPRDALVRATVGVPYYFGTSFFLFVPNAVLHREATCDCLCKGCFAIVHAQLTVYPTLHSGGHAVARRIFL